MLFALFLVLQSTLTWQQIIAINWIHVGDGSYKAWACINFCPLLAYFVCYMSVYQINIVNCFWHQFRNLIRKKPSPNLRVEFIFPLKNLISKFLKSKLWIVLKFEYSACHQKFTDSQHGWIQSKPEHHHDGSWGNYNYTFSKKIEGIQCADVHVYVYVYVWKGERW